MEIPFPIQRRLYRRFGYYLPKNLIRNYFRTEARTSPSLRALEPDISTLVSNTAIAVSREVKRRGRDSLLLYLLYATFAILSAAEHANPDAIFVFTIIGGVFVLAFVVGSRWKVKRTLAEAHVIVWLFFATCFLGGNYSSWPNSNFRWQVARRIERIARKVEQIPLAARSVASDVKKEAFRLSFAKAQAIRQLELWAMRPMAFTFTDLVHQLVLDLSLVLENRWYDLPEADDFKAQRPRWILVSTIGVAVIIAGAAVFLVAFAAKTGPAASIIGLILVTAALALLNNVGISTNLIDQYIQTGSKILPGK